MRSLLRRLVPFAGALLAACSTAHAAPALWRVSDADSHIWLFGSIHILDEARDWRTPTFDAALDAADEVYFEVVMDAPAYATITRLSMIYGLLHNGQRLEDFLSPEQTARYAAFLEEEGLAASQFTHLRPWLVELTLAQLQLAGPADIAGPATTAGIETLLAQEVDPERQRGLETAQTQLRLFIGRTDEEQVEALMATIDAISAGTGGSLTDLADAWFAGDIEALHSEMVEGLGGIDAPYYRRMISDRNVRWAHAAAGLLASNDAAMLVVGAGHLTGPKGLPALLAADGFTVERIDQQDTPPTGGASDRQPAKRR